MVIGLAFLATAVATLFAQATLVRFTTEVFFLEVIPFVPVMYSTTATSAHRDGDGVERVFIERQQVLDVRFTAEIPPGHVQEPPRPRGRRRP